MSASAQPSAPGLRPAPAPPANQTPPALQQVRFDQQLDARLPLDATFRDETGRVVRLGEFFGSRPVVLAFVYYECPMLCTQILNGLVSALGVLEQTAGQEFDVVAISFDARETPVMAAAKKAVYLDTYKRPGAEPGWHFLTGDEASIRRVTDAAGFRFSWDEATQQFAHASGVIVDHARRPAVALPVRHRIPAAGPEVRVDGIVRGQDRIGGRSGAALLLSLRARDRQLQPGGDERRPAGRRRHRGAAAFGFVAMSLRRDGRAAVRALPTLMGGIPLFPEQASSFAADVDALYIFIIAVSAFFTIGVSVAVLFFAIKYRRRHPEQVGAHIEGSLPLELAWSIIPTIISMVMFVWGAKLFYEMRRPPAEALQIYAVGKQWMWKFQHTGGQREINELHVPTGRPIKRPGHVRGRPSRPLLPGLPHQDRRHPRPLHAAVVRQPPSLAATTSSAPNTAAPNIRA